MHCFRLGRIGRCSTEVHRGRRSRSTGAEGEVPQAPSNRSAASHEDEEHPVRGGYLSRGVGAAPTDLSVWEHSSYRKLVP